MEFIKQFQIELVYRLTMKYFTVEILYGLIAVAGGIAKYLAGYINGIPFSFKMFLSSVFVSGFSGYMFAIMAITMNLPVPMQFMMAGTGGFFGDQTMKYIMDYLHSKLK